MHVSNAFEAGGIVIVLAAFIHFQFYAEVSFAVSVKDRCGFVAVFLDLVLKLVKASFTVGQIAVPADDSVICVWILACWLVRSPYTAI